MGGERNLLGRMPAFLQELISGYSSRYADDLRKVVLGRGVTEESRERLREEMLGKLFVPMPNPIAMSGFDWPIATQEQIEGYKNRIREFASLDQQEQDRRIREFAIDEIQRLGIRL
ncbi:hypothetical protein HYU92_00045 [Candidatus Curtissbacteria bacterium]|nr:hypothetical protein [Candidatus Curtissbacteria bacterium]